MDTKRQRGLIEAIVVYFGLMAGRFAGLFLLGAYAQGFKTLDALRNRGSDGFGWTWQAALMVGVSAALLAGGLGVVLQGQRLRQVYWSLCVVSGVLGAVILLTDPSPTLDWLGLFGLPLVGVGVLWLASGMSHNKGSVAISR